MTGYLDKLAMPPLLLWLSISCAFGAGSPDPLDSWTLAPPDRLTNYLRKVIWGNGQFVSVGEFGTTMTSPDGLRWTSRVSGTTNFLSGIAYGNGIFVAVGRSDDETPLVSQPVVVTSTNGIDWVAAPAPQTNH